MKTNRTWQYFSVEVVKMMENARLDKVNNLSTLENEVRRPRRPRSMTCVKLQWVAERARKCRRIKDALEQGTYRVDSREVAKALLNLREEREIS